MKILLRCLSPHANLYRDPRSGIAWVEDTTTGSGHSAHPNIDKSGSVVGMRSCGYWGQYDRVVPSHGFLYNIDRLSLSDEFDRIAASECRCGGLHPASTP